MEAFFSWLNGIIWSNPLVGLCLGAGLWFSIRTRFMQVRGFTEMCRLTVTGQKSDAGVSSFQALAISMAGRMGIGNIAGVATAIAYGGPGAVFWMWVMGFLGASTSYIESTLAQIYKEKDAEGRYRGGPAYYIEKAMGLKWYAMAFALATIVATGLLLPGVQANAIADSASNVLCNGGGCEAFGGAGGLKLWIGVAVATVLALIIFGGIKRIATFAEIVVPFMALAFILMAVVVMVVNADKVPGMFADIFSSAFGAHAAFGAICKTALFCKPLLEDLLDLGVAQKLLEKDVGLQRLELRLAQERLRILLRVVEVKKLAGQLLLVLPDRATVVLVEPPQKAEEGEVERRARRAGHLRAGLGRCALSRHWPRSLPTTPTVGR